jgi:hypothetical protein
VLTEAYVSGLSRSWLSDFALLRMNINLFVYRDTWRRLNEPVDTPSSLPEAVQAGLSLAYLFVIH